MVALSSIVSYSLLAYGVVSVVSIILHVNISKYLTNNANEIVMFMSQVYGVVSAFALARVYSQGPMQPTIKHGFTNF